MRCILATCTAAEADELVLTLLREHLVACGNIIPGVRSHYRWEGEIVTDAEVLLLMETSASRVEAAATRLRELHSYDVPKILTFEPDHCDVDYLRWLRGVTIDAPGT